jgi:predicted outer membrane repeat protein
MSPLRLLPALFVFPLVANGTTVTTATDEDDGYLGGGSGVSLREAVSYSPAGDTITFAPTLSGQTIRLNAQITIAKSLSIDGSSLPERIILSGDQNGNGTADDNIRIFHIGTGTILFDSLVISNGSKSSEDGGGISDGAQTSGGASAPIVTVDSCHFTGNKAQLHGGAIYMRPATTLTIRKSTFVGNSAGSDGGAVRADRIIEILRSTFTGNSARDGGAVFVQNSTGTTANFREINFAGNTASANGGAISLLQGSVLLDRSTVANNSANFGGGIHCRGVSLSVRNSTVSGNSAVSGFPFSRDGGGIYSTGGPIVFENTTVAMNSATRWGGGIFSESNTLITQNCTIVANSAGVGGGGVYGNSQVGATDLRASILAGNTAPADPNVRGTQNVGDNLISNIISLAPLGNYGGPTQTMPPFLGSPAIDPFPGTSTVTNDQRGFPRTGRKDIGAVEFQSQDDATTASHAWNTDADGDGLPYAMERFHGTQPFASDASSNSTLSSPMLNLEGHRALTFLVGFPPRTVGNRASWRLMRSPDLTPGSFTEIYRFDSAGEFTIPGVSFGISFEGPFFRYTITDTNPLPGSGFYRFEAVLAP